MVTFLEKNNAIWAWKDKYINIVEMIKVTYITKVLTFSYNIFVTNGFILMKFIFWVINKLFELRKILKKVFLGI